MKHEVQTNLLGRKVMFTMGIAEKEKLEEQMRSTSMNTVPYWRHLGESGEIVAVFINAEKELTVTIELMDGTIINRNVVHIRIQY